MQMRAKKHVQYLEGWPPARSYPFSRVAMPCRGFEPPGHKLHHRARYPPRRGSVFELCRTRENTSSGVLFVSHLDRKGLLSVEIPSEFISNSEIRQRQLRIRELQPRAGVTFRREITGKSVSAFYTSNLMEPAARTL